MSSDPIIGASSAPAECATEIPPVYRLYYLLGARFRARRVAEFLSNFSVTASTRILDVGGTRRFWQGISANVTTVNLDASDADQAADARSLPFPDRSFDIVFSNSLIEHVGSFQDQIACAREIARVGKRYYVQTPDPRFPMEPHFIAPFIHWFSPAWQRPLARFTPWAILTRANASAIEDFIASIRLLTATEMRQLFPDAQLKRERCCGLSKSLIAQRL